MAIVSLSRNEVDTTSEVISIVLSQVSANSKATYMETIKHFMTYTINRAETHPFQNPYGAIVSYRQFLSENYMTTTANKKLSIVRRFMRVAAIHGLIDREDAFAIESVNGIKVTGDPMRRWLSEDSAKELYAKPDTTTMQGKRDLIILIFGIVMGLRREEMVNLTWGQLEQIGDYWLLCNVVGKGGSVNNVEVPSRYIQAILDFGREADDQPILVAIDRYDHKRQKSMAKESINYVMSKYDVQPHTMRRTCATLILQNGGDIRDAQHQLRHKNQATTEKYLSSFIELGKSASNLINL